MTKLTLNQREAAELIGVHADTLRDWGEDGPPYIRTPRGMKRYPVEGLKEFLKPTPKPKYSKRHSDQQTKPI